jgi:hypothetical protein
MDPVLGRLRPADSEDIDGWQAPSGRAQADPLVVGLPDLEAEDGTPEPSHPRRIDGVDADARNPIGHCEILASPGRARIWIVADVASASAGEAGGDGRQAEVLQDGGRVGGEGLAIGGAQLLEGVDDDPAVY